MKKLKRSLSLPYVIAISIGGMLGSGIFVLPGFAASLTGSSVWLAYLIAALCILPAALSKSELATAMPSSGGTYVYIERAFGPMFGTISGIGLWLSLLLKSSFALIGLGAYLAVLINLDDNLTKLVALGFLCFIMFLNVFGVKKVGKVQIVIVGISLTCLVSIFLIGFPLVNPDYLTPFLSNGNTGLISTVAFVYISYAGVTKVAAIAGEIKNPDRNLPLAMILSLLTIASVYVFIAFVLVGNIPIKELATDIRPIYTVSNIIGGKYFGYAAAAVGVLTLMSMANSGVLASSRFPFAMARDKLLPSFLERLHSKYLTPVISILITCITMAFVIVFLDIVKIAKLASAFKVMMFISVNFCVIILRETSAQWYNPSYKSPLYPFLQLFGIFSGFILLVFLGWMPFFAILVISVLGVFLYFFIGKDATRTGVLRNYGHRPALFLFYKKNRRKLKKEGRSLSKNLDGKLVSNAGVVVPLLGNENSAEMLAEMASAINPRDSVQVVNITEVPNQTFLDALNQDTPKVVSIARRLKKLSSSQNLNIDFESVVTHEVSNTVAQLSGQTNCDWLVMGWNGKAHSGLLIRNPIGWLLTHVNSNFALFKDSGIKNISRVLIALRPGRKDKNFLAVAERVCAFYGASLTLLHIVTPSFSKKAATNMESKSVQLLSGLKIKSDLKIVKSENPLNSISSISSDYDLLVLGAPEKDSWISVLFGAGRDKFTENSACSVLRLTMKN
jgi:amino acid transporter|tara:strand:- start:820 stop:3012 length:2193 start_codon:yes stop_codon:yes gene_type:complete